MMWRQGQIYGGLKGRFGAGTMDCEPDNPEYLQHHGQKVLKRNKRRTKVGSCSVQGILIEEMHDSENAKIVM